MQRTLLLAALVPLTAVVHAQLAPREEASLFQHLLEVNREWRHHADALVDAERTVSFADEADRIAAHLHAVEAYMERTTPEGLSADQAEKRSDALNELANYADRGSFPQNTVLPYRNPIFIDPWNTACAVGQLMIASGSEDLALRIDGAMETAYIREMHWPEIGAWAQENGLTSDELAWIQPGYTPPIPWIALGGGTNGTSVDELLRLANGDLIIAGQFDQAGSTSCERVARWNGTTYEAMGALPEGQVNAAIEFEGAIYLGGSFNGGTVDLLKWNNGVWEESAVFSSKYAETTALHIHGGVLHAAGSRSGFAGIDHSVMRYTGGTWNPVGQVLNDRIEALETFDGTLIAGGRFTDEFLAQGNALMHVVRLNGSTWEQLGEGLDGAVYDLLVSGTDLYATGDMVSEIATYFGLARFAGDALVWVPLMPNIGDYIVSALDGLTHANAMVEHDGRIFIGGEFFVSNGMAFGSNLAVFNGTADDVEPYAAFGGPVHDLDLSGPNQLVACGVIDGLGNIATTDLTTAIGERDAPALLIFPNPTTDHVTVQIPGSIPPNTPVRITDASGRLVHSPVDRVGNALRIDARALATGTYHIEVGSGAAVAQGRFIKK